MADGSNSIRGALKSFADAVRKADFPTAFILLSSACLTLISWYFASRRFFRAELASYFTGDPSASLYEFLYWFAADFVVYFLIPLLLIALVLKRPLRSFGLRLGDRRFGLKVTGLFLLVMLPILWFASADPAFRQVYPHAEIVRTSWNLFLVYEAFFLLYFTGWEFVWRGYMLFGLEKRLGAVNAVLIQTLPFVILHFGKPFVESLGAIVAGIALGALAIRTRSFWYCALTHWLVMLSIDLLSTLRFRTGVEGTGAGDLVALIGKIFGF